MQKHRIGLRLSDMSEELLIQEKYVTIEAINVCEVGSLILTCSSVCFYLEYWLFLMSRQI